MNNLTFEEIEAILESTNLNFLIGSGASKPFLDTLKDIEKTMSAFDKKEGFDENQKDDKVLQIIEVSIKNRYFTKCIEKNLELIKSCDSDNKCREVMGEYKIFLQSLQTILSRRGSNNCPKQVNLFTTNIDVFLDVALTKSWSFGFK